MATVPTSACSTTGSATEGLFGFEGLGRLHFVRLHNAILSLLAIPAAFRIGRVLGGRVQAGVLSAGLTALLPSLAYFSCHALAEWHALILLTWAYVLWLEGAQEEHDCVDARRSLFLGLLVGVPHPTGDDSIAARNVARCLGLALAPVGPVVLVQ